jgi:para-nitrobenzyl esterase
MPYPNRAARAALALIAALAMPAAAADIPAAPGLTVTTDAGTVRGALTDGVESWKGIPFAAPPVGPLRWRAPQPPAHWSGVRDATAYGHDCMQKPFAEDAAPLATTPSEDCLYVNVWRPEASGVKLPVIVWIYGGGFVNGGSSPPTYSGAALARQGVMFVSFNYRLGRFGTFAFPQLTAADPDRGLIGNYGFLDQLAALRWVQNNIARFGGDPENVTIIGESAGGMSVHALVTSPLTHGLFEKAVVMSGGDGSTMGRQSLADVEQIGARFAQSKGIAPDDRQALTKLRALPAKAVTDDLNLATLSAKHGAPTFSSPFADGRIAVNGITAYRSGAFAHVPMIVGATSGDIGGPTGYMIAGAKRIAQTLSAAGVPVYEYRFSYVADSVRTAETTGAAHASDIPFFFHTEDVKYGEGASARDRGVGSTISSYIVNFARTGDPNGAGLPAWPRYEGAADRLMDFTEQGTAVAQKDPLGAAIDAANPAS